MRQSVLREIRDRLDEAYGERLRGVMLYGSEARDRATAESDVDLLVLLKGPVR
ncbi:MAG: nucleotidyltransferase domain-containing protein [Candidatus Brocadiia bacterium]